MQAASFLHCAPIRAGTVLHPCSSGTEPLDGGKQNSALSSCFYSAVTCNSEGGLWSPGLTSAQLTELREADGQCLFLTREALPVSSFV